jgi:hypothetical protein
MSSKKNKKTQEDSATFLLKKDDKLYIFPNEIMNALTIDEAFTLGMSAHIEQRRQLLQDATQGDHYIESIKVVDGLESSLKRLEELFPKIRKQIADFDKGYHVRIGRS